MAPERELLDNGERPRLLRLFLASGRPHGAVRFRARSAGALFLVLNPPLLPATSAVSALEEW